MPDFDAHGGWGLRRLLVSLTGLVLFGTLAVVALSATGVAHLLPMHASAASFGSDVWTFARPAVDRLNASAIQICAAEANARAAEGTANEDVRRAQVEVLSAEYRQSEQDYNKQVRDLIASGNQRPWDVPSKALPLDLARNRNCMKVAVAPPSESKSLAALAVTLTSGEEVGDTWLPDPEHRFLTLEQLDAAAALAGWPNEPGWWPDMRKIILCETRSLDTMAHNTSDPHGGSYGLAQLNGSYHFVNAGEDFSRRYDPVVNLRTALWLRTVRGHFGGGGGWYNCAKLWGID